MTINISDNVLIIDFNYSVEYIYILFTIFSKNNNPIIYLPTSIISNLIILLIIIGHGTINIYLVILPMNLNMINKYIIDTT